jgi:hypothetical protein
LPDGTWSRDYPAYHGLHDQLTAAERGRREDFKAAEAPSEVQEIFDHIISGLAQNDGYKGPNASKAFVYEVYGGVVYHFGLNYMGAHTIHHVDEYETDGPGTHIANLSLQGDGLLYFYQDRPRPDGSWLPQLKIAAAVLQRPGDCVGFSRDARLYSMHGVVKELPIVTLPTIPGMAEEEKAGTAGWEEAVRVVASIRGGDMEQGTGQLAAQWQEMWTPSFEEDAQEATAKKAKEAKAAKKAKDGKEGKEGKDATGEEKKQPGKKAKVCTHTTHTHTQTHTHTRAYIYTSPTTIGTQQHQAQLTQEGHRGAAYQSLDAPKK